MAKQIVSEGVSKDTVSALKDAVKSHYDIPQGSSLSGTVTFQVQFDYKRGEDYSKTVPQAACPWSLLACALKRMGVMREGMVEIAAEVQAMTDAERKEMRDTLSDQVSEIMSEIGATTVRHVKGMQTFDSIQVTVNP